MNRQSKNIVAVLILIAVVVTYLLPPMGALSREAIRASALVLFAIGFWATGVASRTPHVADLYAAGHRSKVASPQVVLSGFYSMAIWLVFGGMVLAAAVKPRAWAVAWPTFCWAFGASYLGAIAGMVLLAVAFSFFIPSTMGRVVLLVPVAMAVAERLGFEEDSSGYDGLVMAAALACFVPSCSVLPANVPNMVAAGTAETLY